MAEGKENLPWAQPNFKPSATLDLSGTDLGAIGATSLAEFMRRDKTIQALDLTQAQIASNLDGSAGYNDKGIEALAVALSVNSTLKSLKLFANHLRDESVDHIVKIVLGNDTLKSLNVGYNDFSAKGIQEISNAVASSESLEELTVGAGTIHVQQVKGRPSVNSHKSKKSKKKTLRTLKLKNKSLGPLSALVVSRLLKHNNIVQAIDLSHNSLRKEGTRAICDALASLATLEEVNISSNEIFPDGGESMAKLVANSNSLKVLKLAENNLTNWGRDCAAMEHIVENALRRGMLRVLHLQGNVMRETGAAVIAKFIQESTSLVELNVSRSQLGAEGAIEISKALSNCTKESTLKTLKIAENNIGGRGATPIIEAICNSNHQLVNLNFAKNNITEGAALGWIDLLLHHRDEWNLEEIDLMGNRIAQSLQDDFLDLPKRTPNRYGIMSGISRVAALKEFRKNYDLFKDGKDIDELKESKKVAEGSDDDGDLAMDIDENTEENGNDDVGNIAIGVQNMEISPRVERERDERTKLAVMNYVNSTVDTLESPQTNSILEASNDAETFSSSDEDDLDPATLAAMRDAYAGISGAVSSDHKSEASGNISIGSSNSASLNQANTGVHGFNDGDSIGNAAVIQSLGGGAGTGKSQVQGLSPRRVGSSSGSGRTSGIAGVSDNEGPRAPTSKKEPPRGPKPSNISQGRRALLKVNSTDEYEAVNGPPQPPRKMKKRQNAAELKKMREQQEEDYKRQEAVAKSYELYKQQKAARAAKKK
eukprot:g13650.t1